MNLLESCQEYKESASFMEDVAKGFATLRLPMPGNGEFIRGFDTCAYVVPMTDHGVIVKVARNDQPRPIEHPFILQPLGSLTFNNARFDIYPGVRLNPSPETVAKLDPTLESAGLAWKTNPGQPDQNERRPDNCGLMPAKTETFPDGIPVIIDAGAIRIADMERYTEYMNKNLGDGKTTMFLQKRLYGDLSHSFNSAAKTADFDPFWSRCRLDCQKGILNPGWMDVPAESGPDHKDSLLREGALRYSERILAHPGMMQQSTVSSVRTGP